MQRVGQTTYTVLGEYVSDIDPIEAWGRRLPDYKASSGAPIARQDPAGFQGQDGAYTDLETGLVLMGHRYYSPGTGRFPPRTIAYAGESPQPSNNSPTH